MKNVSKDSTNRSNESRTSDSQEKSKIGSFGARDRITENSSGAEGKYARFQEEAKYGNLEDSLKAKIGNRSLKDTNQRKEILKEMEDDVSKKEGLKTEATNHYNNLKKHETESFEKETALIQQRGESTEDREFQPSDKLRQLEAKMKEAELNSETAQKNSLAFLNAAKESDKAIKGLAEAGPTDKAAEDLKLAVDEYKVAVQELIKSKDKEKAGASVENAIKKVQTALQNASEGIEVNQIEQNILDWEHEVDRYTKLVVIDHKLNHAADLATAQKTLKTLKNIQSAILSNRYGIKDSYSAQDASAKTIAELSARHKDIKTVPELKAIQQRSVRLESISQTFDNLKTSIAKNGATRKILEQISELEKSVGEQKALQTKAQKVLGDFDTNSHSLATVNQSIEDLKHIDTLLAVETGVQEFQTKNNELLDKCQNLRNSWIFSLCTAFIGNLVVMAVQSYYKNEGAAAEAFRVEANELLGEILGIPKDELKDSEMIEKGKEVINDSGSDNNTTTTTTTTKDNESKEII